MVLPRSFHEAQQATQKFIPGLRLQTPMPHSTLCARPLLATLLALASSVLLACASIPACCADNAQLAYTYDPQGIASR